MLNTPISYTVSGSGGTTYVVKNHGDHWSCSCPAWRFMGGPCTDRRCKHIRALVDSKFTVHVNTTTSMSSRKRKAADTLLAAGKVPSVALAKEWEGQDPLGYLISGN